MLALSPLALRLGLAVGLSALVIGGALYLRSGGYSACERDHKAAALEAAEQMHATYIAEVERGDKLAVALQDQRRENQRLRDKHADHARLLVGTCPSGLRTLHDAAASGTELSQAAIGTLNSTGTVAASAIAESVTNNYATARDCQDQLNKLIDWHSK
jgi:hypothetical protein